MKPMRKSPAPHRVIAVRSCALSPSEQWNFLSTTARFTDHKERPIGRHNKCGLAMPAELAQT